MNFLWVTKEELSALMGLPYLQQVAYLMGIKPYMDRQTSLVGIKRRISYQSLAEVLYVEAHQGIKSSTPSRDQLRRVIKSLARAGLIEVQSDSKHLILKCLLSASDFSVQNKAATNPPSQAATNSTQNNPLKSIVLEVLHRKADIGQTEKAAIPQYSNNNICVVLREKFEKFWESYPQPQNQSKAWEAFQRLNPDEALFQQIMTALQVQITHYKEAQQHGNWVPHWKYPANWIIQQGWNDELITYSNLEKTHGKHTKHSKKSGVDLLWESCKDGCDFEFSEEISNVIPFRQNN